MKCPDCGAEDYLQGQTCASCGSEPRERNTASKGRKLKKWDRTLREVRTADETTSTMCGECGATNFPGESKCRSCGAPLAKVTTAMNSGFVESERWNSDAPNAYSQDRKTNTLGTVVGPLMTIAFIMMVFTYLYQRASDAPDTLDAQTLLDYRNWMEFVGNVCDVSFFVFCASALYAIYLLAGPRR